MARKTLRFLLAMLGMAAAAGCYGASLTPVAAVPFAAGLSTHGTGLVAGTFNGGLTAILADGSTAPFSALSGLTGEPNLIECPIGLPRYGPGTIYVPGVDVGGSPQTIFRVSADGTLAQVFASIPTASPLASLAFDTTGGWQNLLYALTEDGKLWLIGARGEVVLLLNVGPFTLPFYCEGLTILPQRPALGPLSGALTILPTTNRPDLALSGNVIAVTRQNNQFTVNNVPTGLHSVEQLALIPPAQNCYVASFGTGRIYGITAADLAPFAGTLLAQVEDDDPTVGAQAGLWGLVWNGALFAPEPIALMPGMVPEGVVFTKNGIGPVPPAP